MRIVKTSAFASGDALCPEANCVNRIRHVAMKVGRMGNLKLEFVRCISYNSAADG